MPPGWTIEVMSAEPNGVPRPGLRRGRLIGPGRVHELTTEDLQLIEEQGRAAAPTILERYEVGS